MTLTAYPWANFWLVASVVLIGGHMLYLRKQGRLLVFDPLFTFWAGYYMCYISEVLDYSDVFVNWHSVEILDRTLFYCLVAIACVVKGYEMDWGPRLAARFPNFTTELDPHRFFVAAAVCTGLGLSAYYFFFQSAGGMTEWLSYGRGGTDYEKVSGYVFELEKLTTIGVYLLLMHVCLHPVSDFKKIAIWAFVALLLLWYYYLGTRSRVIGVSMLAAAAYFVPKHRNPSLFLIVPAFIALIVLTRFQEHYRGNFTNLSFNMDQLDMDEVKALCLPSSLGGDKEVQRKTVTEGVDFNVILATVELVPHKVPYNYGWNFVGFLTGPIPRAIWPNKIYPALEAFQGVVREGGLSNAYVADRDLLIGPSFSFVAFWYYILGPLALVLGGLYTGILFRLLRSLLERAPHSEGNLVVYNTLLIIGFYESGGSPFLWVYDFPITTMPPLLLLLYLCRKDRSEPFFPPNRAAGSA